MSTEILVLHGSPGKCPQAGSCDTKTPPGLRLPGRHVLHLHAITREERRELGDRAFRTPPFRQERSIPRARRGHVRQVQKCDVNVHDHRWCETSGSRDGKDVLKPRSASAAGSRCPMMMFYLRPIRSSRAPRVGPQPDCSKTSKHRRDLGGNPCETRIVAERIKRGINAQHEHRPVDVLKCKLELTERG